jgi:Spy/CpxP family protein refolding chaperone
MSMSIRFSGGRVWRKAWLALPMLAALALTGAAGAKPCGHCDGHGGRGHGGPSLDRLERKVERLDLEAEQRKAIYAAIDQARVQERETRSQVRASHERLRELLAAQGTPEADVLALADSIGTLKTEAAKSRLRTMLQIRGMVSAEQWQELQPKSKRGGGHQCEESSESGQSSTAAQPEAGL